MQLNQFFIFQQGDLYPFAGSINNKFFVHHRRFSKAYTWPVRIPELENLKKHINSRKPYIFW